MTTAPSRHAILLIICVAVFIVKLLLDAFGGQSPIDLIALGLLFGFASFL